MRQRVFGLLFGCAVAVCGAQEEPAVSAAQDIEPASPPAAESRPGSLELDFDIFKEIQIELLDLDALVRAARERFVGETIRMGVLDCVHAALEQNQDLLISYFDPQMADADIQAAKGEFDPQLSGSFNYVDASSAASSQIVAFGGFSSVESYSTTSQLSLRGKLKPGTQYEVRFNVNRDEGTFSQFIEEFNSSYTISVTQPILRGFGTYINRIRVRTAKNAKIISATQVEATLITVVGDVIKAYWDLVGAVENLRVQQESLDNARRALHISERRLEVGEGAALDVMQAKAGVATRMNDYIAAVASIANAEDNLKRLMSMRDDGGLFSARSIFPTDRPNVSNVEWDLETSLRRALENRPEMRIADLNIENASMELDRARNELLPQVDISASVTNGALDHKLSESIYGTIDQRDRTYQWGISGSIPIGNRAARGAHTRAKLSLRQNEQRLLKTREDLMLNVRTALRNVVSSQARVEANRQAQRLQQASVAAEERRLAVGLTTSQAVLDIQEDLTLAQTQLLQSEVEFEKAMIDLQSAEGILLQALSIEVDIPEAEAPISFLRSVTPTGWVTPRPPAREDGETEAGDAEGEAP